MGLRDRIPDMKERASEIANILMRYGPPTAVGAYAGDRLMNWPVSDAYRDAARRFAVNYSTPDIKYAPKLPAFD